MLSEDRYDFGNRWYITPKRGALFYILFMSVLAVLTYIGHLYPISLQIAVSTLAIYLMIYLIIY
jgi:hypothetical protein